MGNESGPSRIQAECDATWPSTSSYCRVIINICTLVIPAEILFVQHKQEFISLSVLETGWHRMTALACVMRFPHVFIHNPSELVEIQVVQYGYKESGVFFCDVVTFHLTSWATPKWPSQPLEITSQWVSAFFSAVMPGYLVGWGLLIGRIR